MTTAWLSTYGNTYFGVASVGAAVASMLIFLTAFIIVCFLAKRTPSIINNMSTCGCLCMGFVATLLVTAQILWVLACAGISGSGYLGQSGSTAGGMFVVASLPLLWVVPFAVTALSPRLWKGHAAYSSSKSVPFCCGTVGFAFSASLRSVGLKPFLVWSLVIVSLSMTALTFLGLQGLCYCSNPSEVSSWASRRVDPPFCIEGTICHSYFLLGENPDSLTLVLQWVDGPLGKCSSCASAEAVICEVSTPGGDSSSCTSTPVTVQATKVIPYHYMSEDLRTIAHIRLTGLRPSQGYRVEARLLDGPNGNRVNIGIPASTAVLYPRTVPSLTDTTTDISFVGGGDYYMGQRGIETLVAALQVTPDAQFIFLGGDLSYSNNMRTCYRRWDQFFIELTKARTNAFGWSLPLTVMPGNHESGGYLENDDYSDTASNFQYFYREYFPHEMTTRTTSTTTSFYHSHKIGAGLGLLMLDSGCFTKIKDQIPFIEETLTNWTSSSPSPRFAIPMTHVSAFPGRIRDSSADRLPKQHVKDTFVPVFERYNVSTVFQFHEHVYFRSREIDTQGNTVAVAAGGPARRGIVYLGDGAMGVAKSDRVAMPSGSGYSAVTYSEWNFAYSVKYFGSSGNRSLHVDAVTPKDVDVKTAGILGRVMDSVDIAPRN